jgi:16S rRNA (guanine527-N7)-methyltransferase
MTSAITQLQLQAEDWGVRLEQASLERLSKYARVLATYEAANVIGTNDTDTIILEHLLDSLSCLTFAGVQAARTLIDVGSGGGLPGIPLSIAAPHLQVTLLEATEKKVRFLEHVRTQLNLENIEVLHARAEDIGLRPEYRETFDLTTARALASLPVVLEYCAPLVRVEGTILAMKGRLSTPELLQAEAASSELGVALQAVQTVRYLERLPQKERRLVVLQKVRPTPEQFPRRVGLPKKRPLGA